MNYKAFSTTALIFSAALLNGCSNHVRVDTEVQRDIDRQALSRTINLDADAKGHQITVKSEQREHFRITESERTVTFDVATPYQPARELYEPFVGIFSITAGVVVNVIDFALLGLIPNEFTNKPLYVGFAGLNPFMNIESTTRVERKQLTDDVRVLDEREEYVTKPFAGEVTFNSGTVRLAKAVDNNGTTDLDLFDIINATGADLRKLTVSAGAEENQVVKHVFIDRRVQARLMEAERILGKYQQETGQDLKVVAADIHQLAELGFNDKSLKLEELTRAAMSTDQNNELTAEINKLYM